jgi:hypothetical protein
MNLKLEEQENQLTLKKNQEKTEKEDMSISTTTDNVDPPQDYEIMLQKLEAEVRNHIRVIPKTPETSSYILP